MHRITNTLNIRDLRQWVCWRTEERDGKLTKVPYSPLTAEKASKEHGCGGIGFVFTEDDPYCGVDLDKCREPESGEIEDWARELIEQLNSYTELSPSGTGVHILVKAQLPSG